MNNPPTPVVLVGGKSSRFGADKLRHQVNGRALVQYPIHALRTALGTPVYAAGAAHPDVLKHTDQQILDNPTLTKADGPILAICSALAQLQTDLFVLPGDLPNIRPEDVARITDEAARHPDALAVLARDQQPQPCVGVYRTDALPHLRAAGDRQTSLATALADHKAMWIAFTDPWNLTNINQKSNLPNLPNSQ